MQTQHLPLQSITVNMTMSCQLVVSFNLELWTLIFKLLPSSEIHFSIHSCQLFHSYGNCLSSGLDLMQPYSPYIHAKHCCEVHYLKFAGLGWVHVISLTVLSGSSFLLHQTRDICFPLPYDFSFTIRSRCHSLQATCHISRLPVYVFSHGTS